jgi:hypothetical protein
MKIARPPRKFEPEEQADWNEEVERTINGVLATTSDWSTITNVTPDRSYDADATSTAELADVLGTLISDLRTKGLLT